MSDISEQINILVEVQGVEMEILQARRKVDALNGEAVSLDKALADREAEADLDRQALDELKKSYRELELESKQVVDLITKSNEKLRAVKTNKEYQSILKEIEEIRKKKMEIEDRMIEFLEQIESSEARVADSETQLAVFIESCREKKETLAAQGEQQQQVVVSLTDKKTQIEGKTDPENIALLNDVKKKVRGKPVVPVQGAICLGCHMNIPAQLSNELQRLDQFRFCPHCHRIIYWKGKE